jgi:hypothetical protein
MILLLKDHTSAIVACDLSMVASATFQLLTRVGGHGIRIAPAGSP